MSTKEETIQTEHLRLRELLLIFFNELGKFQFSKAIKVLKTKLYAVKLPRNLVYLLPPLLLLVAVESGYYNLAFTLFDSKRFKEMYNQVLLALDKVCAEIDDKEKSVTKIEKKREASFFSHLLKQTLYMISHRMKMIDIYVSFLDTNTMPAYNELKKKLNNMQMPLSTIFTHPFLQQIRHNLSSELSLFEKLVASQIKISKWKFKDALFFICQSQADIDSWKFKFDFSENQNTWFALHSWFCKYHRALLSKFRLYFRNKLLEDSRREFQIKDKLSFSPVDHVETIQKFVSESSCFNITFVLQPPLTKKSEGIKDWPGVFTCPQSEPPTMHWPNIISLITDNLNILDMFTLSPLYYYDTKVNTTYFIIKVEERMSVVIMFIDKKDKDDSIVNDFILNLVSELRNSKIFLMLKPQGSYYEVLNSRVEEGNAEFV